MDVTLNPTASLPTVAAFDGRVLEIFWPAQLHSSERHHIAHIASVQLGPDKKGKQILKIKTRSGGEMTQEVEPEALGQALALAAAVQQALAAL